MRAICQAARAHVKVLIGGEGSDELWAGYAGRYTGLLANATSHRRLRTLRHLLPSREARWWPRRLRLAGQRARTSPLADMIAVRAEGIGPRHPWLLQHAPHLARQLRDRATTRASTLILPATSSPLDLAQYLDLSWQLPESLLVKADRMSMAASVELRCPFLDPAVAAVAARVAPAARLSPTGAPGKLPLRALIDRWQPGENNRPKQGFPLPLGRWLRGPLAADVRLHLTAPDSTFVAHVGRPAAQAWCDDFASGRVSAHQTYAVWLYERWRRQRCSSSLPSSPLGMLQPASRS